MSARRAPPSPATQAGRRTQAQRSAATREVLRAAARRLWGERGYAEVSTPEIAQEAGVTRGALYHQFPDKNALFIEVLNAIEGELMQRMVRMVATSEPQTPADALHAAADAWIELAGEQEVRQIVLLDAPSILGWAGFREISLSFGLAMTEQLLQSAIDAGQLRPQPVRPLATVLLGALDEAAMSIANAPDPAREMADVRPVIHDLIDGLAATRAAKPSKPQPTSKPAKTTATRAAKPTKPQPTSNPAKTAATRAAKPTKPQPTSKPAKTTATRAAKPTKPQPTSNPAKTTATRAAKPTKPQQTSKPAKTAATRAEAQNRTPPPTRPRKK